ncbi:putative general amidase GmdA [Lepidopterella palustris CBS 459.81]|uniref:amidase n=1 Tax=Lepidopterella palustris CBS 459.81 TaxID=1314670 RepID=A0A8E2DWM5_9PEZI|nr:putative general amidase GmdA [Lepidopterella palustris CBS 459.81]
MATDWKKRAQQKRDSVNALIPHEHRIKKIPSPAEQRDVTGSYVHQFLSQREIEITETTANDLVKHTIAGSWSAVEVTKAFCHRAALAHQLVNCLHEIFFDTAIHHAQTLDNYYAKHKKPVGPLHGLPVSLKDQFHVKGVETTMGYVGWIGTFQGKTGTGKEKVFESEMVRELHNLGAVLYCKTSVPHTLMAGETMNNIIGYTTNPKNRHLSSGGSSGGEGALIGLKGSPVGFGTDIGGSIRIPAAFNGLYGIRPSKGRMPYEGMANSMDGQNSILSVVGPLATSVPSLRLVMKALLSQEPWLHDPGVNELPWRYEQEKEILELTGGIGDASKAGKLSFGLLKHDGLVTPTPPVRRAMDIIVKALEKLGHEVIEWKPPSHRRIIETAFKVWLYDGGEDVHDAFKLSGEPMCPQIASYHKGPVEQMKASDIAAVNITIREIQREYMEYWNTTKNLTSTGRPVDAVIAPVAPFPAARPELYDYYGYTTFVNLLDYTAVVVPVTTVDKKIDVADVEYTPRNEPDRAVYKSYDPEIYDGAHVALQLVGRRLQEEKMLAIAEYVGSALGK